MSLSELLDSLGMEKGEFAKLMGVSRKTVTRWLVKDEVTDDMLEAVKEYERPPEEVFEILPITPENIALSCTWHDLDNIQVARRFGLSRFRYNEEVAKTIIYCQDNNTSFMELRGLRDDNTR